MHDASNTRSPAARDCRSVECGDNAVSQTQLRRWEQRTDLPMIGLALVFTAGYAWPIIWPDTSPLALHRIEVLSVAIWVLFAIDLAVRLTLTDTRGRFLRRNWLDVLALLVPAIRALRVLRILALAGLIARRSKSGLRVRASIYSVGVAALLVFAGGLAATEAERGHDGNIETVADGWWWALTTLTTVGYGDRYPVTTTGRLVAAVLMLAGIGLIGVITATLASWFLEQVQDTEEELEEQFEDAVAEPMQALAAEVLALRIEVSKLQKGITREAD